MKVWLSFEITLVDSFLFRFSSFQTCRFARFLTVRMFDLPSRDRGFLSRSGHYHVVSNLYDTWMSDCLLTGKSSRYTCITNHQSQLSFPSLRGREIAITGLLWGWAGSPVSSGR